MIVFHTIYFTAFLSFFQQKYLFLPYIDKLDEKDVTVFIDRITLPLATISIVSQTYGIILSKEKKKIDKILEKFRKDKDNRSA